MLCGCAKLVWHMFSGVCFPRVLISTKTTNIERMIVALLARFFKAPCSSVERILCRECAVRALAGGACCVYVMGCRAFGVV